MSGRLALSLLSTWISSQDSKFCWRICRLANRRENILVFLGLLPPLSIADEMRIQRMGEERALQPNSKTRQTENGPTLYESRFMAGSRLNYDLDSLSCCCCFCLCCVQALCICVITLWKSAGSLSVSHPFFRVCAEAARQLRTSFRYAGLSFLFGFSFRFFATWGDLTKQK